MQLTDKKVAAKVVLDRSDHFHCLATKRVKRVCDNRVKTQTPGIMTLLPMRVAPLGGGLPHSLKLARSMVSNPSRISKQP
jgi:hypothetical protein